MAVGPWQILVIIVLLLLLFGATRLAEIGKGLGEGIRNFKRGIAGETDGKTDDDATEGGEGAPKQLPDQASDGAGPSGTGSSGAGPSDSNDSGETPG
jgi:sec-independent protein translocase protein TatA